MQINTIDLVKKYRHVPVVNGISLQVEQGEVVGLLGPNGAGKTTTFYMIVGLLKPSSGRVFLDNREITHQPMYQRARAGISYLPQEASVFRNLTVEENLLLVLEMQPLTHSERKERAEHLMEKLQITRVRQRQGKMLSGGERRRVEIARALATRPKFILLDEPFTGVDPKAIEDIGEIIYELAHSADQIGILITDHNVEAMLDITERAYIIVGGEKRVEGISSKLIDDPVAREAYFGENYGRGHDFAREAAEEELRRASGAWNIELPEEPPKAGAPKAESVQEPKRADDREGDSDAAHR